MYLVRLQDSLDKKMMCMSERRIGVDLIPQAYVEKDLPPRHLVNIFILGTGWAQGNMPDSTIPPFELDQYLSCETKDLISEGLEYVLNRSNRDKWVEENGWKLRTVELFGPEIPLARRNQPGTKYDVYLFGSNSTPHRVFAAKNGEDSAIESMGMFAFVVREYPEVFEDPAIEIVCASNEINSNYKAAEYARKRTGVLYAGNINPEIDEPVIIAFPQRAQDMRRTLSKKI